MASQDKRLEFDIKKTIWSYVKKSLPYIAAIIATSAATIFSGAKNAEEKSQLDVDSASVTSSIPQIRYGNAAINLIEANNISLMCLSESSQVRNISSTMEIL